MARNGDIMRTTLVTPAITGIFLLCVFSFLGYQRLHKPRVFILHSYNKHYSWNERINQGVRRVFNNKAYISIRHFYMDAKRRSSKPYMKRISKAAIATIKAWKPDVLITVDNDAQELISKHFSKFQDMKIIMAGVTDNQQWLKYNHIDNVVNITEEIPVNAIREVLSLIFRRERRIYYLSDDSTTSKMLEKNMLRQHWGSYDLVSHRRIKTFRELKAAVKEAGDTADILLISVYHSIKEGSHYVNSKKLVTWMNEHSKIPVVGVYESFIIDGGMIAIAISGIEQGYSAAWLAFNIIEKKISISEIPLLRGKTFSLFLNKHDLRKRFPQAQIPVILDTLSKPNPVSS